MDKETSMDVEQEPSRRPAAVSRPWLLDLGHAVADR